MSNEFKQRAVGAMTYPRRGTLNRLLFKTPLLWWRMGLGPLLGRWMLALTTRGRTSGLPRHTLLSYTALDGTTYLIAGWGDRSDWYRNIEKDAHVTFQTVSRPQPAIARRVAGVEEYASVMRALLDTGGDSHFYPWLKSLDILPDLDDLTAKRDRVHLIALEPTDEQGPPPLKADLVWLWPVLILLLIGVGVAVQFV